MRVYITGRDRSGNPVILTTDGSYYTLSTSSDVPQPITAAIAIALSAGSTTVNIPDYLSSSRLWIADGDLSFSEVITQFGPGLVTPTVVNPSDGSIDVNWGFAELTWIQAGLWANPSAVDFVGLPVGLQLATTSGQTQYLLDDRLELADFE